MNKIITFLLLVILFVLSANFVLAEEALNVQIELPELYHSVEPGDEVLFNVKVLNLGSESRQDVFLDYWVTSPDGTDILNQRETVAIETQANFVKSLQLPDNVGPGEYQINSKITFFNGEEITANHAFQVSITEVNLIIYYVLGGILAVSLLVLLIYFSKNQFQKLKVRTKVWRLVRKKKLRQNK